MSTRLAALVAIVVSCVATAGVTAITMQHRNIAPPAPVVTQFQIDFNQYAKQLRVLFKIGSGSQTGGEFRQELLELTRLAARLEPKTNLEKRAAQAAEQLADSLDTMTRSMQTLSMFSKADLETATAQSDPTSIPGIVYKAKVRVQQKTNEVQALMDSIPQYQVALAGASVPSAPSN